MVWEAHKAVIRGVLIRHGARLKKARTKQLDALLVRLQTLEASHKATPTRQLGGELDTVRSQITDLLQYSAKAAIQVCWRKTYESGNKCGKLLAHSLRTQRAASFIPHILSPTCQKRSLPQQISREFNSFYSSLYNLPETPATQADMIDYLERAAMPLLPTES